MQTRVVEVRPAEGGADSKLFAADLVGAYVRLAARRGWRCRAARDGDAGEG